MQLGRSTWLAVTAALALLTPATRAFADDGAPAAPEAPAATDTPAPEPPAPEAPAPAPTATGSNLTVRASTEVGAYADSTATTVLTPSIAAIVESPTAGWNVAGRYLVDVVSAASPDIISTASPNFTEIRHAGSLGGRYKPGDFGVALAGATSYTPDYLAISGSGQLILDLDDKNLTLTGGYGYGRDTIGRTGTPFSVFSRTLEYHSISAGASRVVNPGLVVGLFGEAILERGDQSKPYRYIPIFSPEIAATIPRGASADSVAATRLEARPLEQLPLARDRFAITGRLAWRGTSTTLRFEERIYTDSWGLQASTSDARYFIDVSERVMIWPHARFHLQGGADFWQRAYAARDVHDIPALRTGDRELGPLTNLGGGGGLRVALGKAGRVDDWSFTATGDTFWTSFADAIYVKERFSALVTVGMEVVF